MKDMIEPVLTIDLRPRLLLLALIFAIPLVPIMWGFIIFDSAVVAVIAVIVLGLPFYVIGYLIFRQDRFEFFEDKVTVSRLGRRSRSIDYSGLRIKGPFQGSFVSAGGYYKLAPHFTIETLDGLSSWKVNNFKIKKLSQISALDWVAEKVRASH